MFEKLKADETYEDRHLLGKVDFECKEQKLPIQAADIWAYESYQHLRLRVLPPDPLKIPQARLGYQMLLLNPWILPRARTAARW
jgi:hypothetical protein